MKQKSMFCGILLLLLTSVISLVYAQTPTVEEVLDEARANAKILRETTTLSLAKVHRLEVWAVEPTSPIKSMRIGILEADLRDHLATYKSISQEIAATAYILPKIDERIWTDALSNLAANILATQEVLSIHLTNLVAATHSEDFGEAAQLGTAMDTDFHTLKLHAHSTLMQIRRIDRNFLH